MNYKVIQYIKRIHILKIKCILLYIVIYCYYTIIKLNKL